MASRGRRKPAGVVENGHDMGVSTMPVSRVLNRNLPARPGSPQ
jgi:hypothetical protein